MIVTKEKKEVGEGSKGSECEKDIRSQTAHWVPRGGKGSYVKGAGSC